MSRIKMATILVAVMVVYVPAAIAAPYKCKTNDGHIEFTDMPCSSGFRQEGDRWIDVDAERKQKHSVERMQRDAKLRQTNKNDSSSLVVNEAVNSSVVPQDIDKLTTYSVILGRAIGCGADVGIASRRVGHWMDMVFPPGSVDQQTYLPIFMSGTRYHAEQQRLGKSPDSCTTVLRSFSGFPWP